MSNSEQIETLKEKYFETVEYEEERVFLIGLQLPGQSALLSEQNLKELERLGKTAGGVIVGMEHIILRKINPAHFIGKGNAEAIACIAQELNATTIVFDEDLSPAQTRNLEEIFETKVIDRATLILDIFAQKAQSHEGKLQVELAQLEYMLPRLRGLGTVLSRLGGGIGTRGPGETKLETDRRRIMKRIATLKNSIKAIEKTRETQRHRRQKSKTPTISLIGYTNAGKSTLLNALTQADVLVEDKLFSTLDPTARKLIMPDGSNAVLVDTVGFIRKLPHALIASFRATLEEAKYADLLLLIIDSSSVFRDEELKASHEVLEILKATDKPVLTVLNKIDQVEDIVLLNEFCDKTAPSVKISAKNTTGFDELLTEVAKLLNHTKLKRCYQLPYNRFDLLAKIHAVSETVKLEYLDNSIQATVRIDARFTGEIEKDEDIAIS